MDRAAVKLQAWWRMTVLRRAYIEARAQWLQMKQADGAGANQAHVQEDPGTWHAAVAIQNCWRGYMSTRIFRYYRDLISFQERGIPNQLLRCVNPAEARLLDAATHTHVRFRLGGESFPPTIFYKVFCHGGLLDIGAFAPRDYTREGSKKALPRHSIRTGDVLPDHSHDGWYRREENNHWRPMSMKLVEEGLDLHLGRIPAGQVTFHHSKSLRRDEREHRRRLRKREWFQKMYREGMDEARKIAASLLNVGEVVATDTVQDGGENEEVDQLLSWTEQLDFDQYYNSWLAVATSSRSDRSFFADATFFEQDDAAASQSL